MPTYPFLPECEASHHHYLILDLDETLIHFEPEKNLFHVRPYT
jgi:predicted HAD superfamily phosphohydrolase YqeG